MPIHQRPAGSDSHKIRVLYIADVPVTGGATESLVQLLIELKEQYAIEPIVCTSQLSELNTRLQNLGITSLVTGHQQFLYSPPPLVFLKPFKILAAFLHYKIRLRTSLASIRNQVNLERIDLVHSNLPRTDLGEIISRESNIPHICHLREFSFDDFRCVSFRRHPARFLSDNSAALIAVSKSVKDAWVARGAEADKIHVIYNGVIFNNQVLAQNVPYFAPSESGVARCVFLGGCSEAKGVWVAIRAIERLLELMPITLDIFGGDSRATIAKVHAYVWAKKLSSVIRLHHRDPNIRTKLQHFNLGIVCSKAEAFGRVVIEYQAAGIPVIGPDTGAIPELIADGKNGYLYNHAEGDRSLSRQIQNVYCNPASWHRVQRNGLDDARQFTSARNTQQIAQLYSQILQCQRADSPNSAAP